jgi:hypothetical protein
MVNPNRDTDTQIYKPQAQAKVSSGERLPSTTETPLLSDAPAEQDLLGYADYRDALTSVIEGLTGNASPTIGVFGEWGSGKTTLLRMVQKQLKDNGIETVWINIWQFSNQQDVWVAFLQSLLIKIKQDMSWWRRLKFSSKVLKRQINWLEIERRLPMLLARIIIVVLPLFVSLYYLGPLAQEESSSGQAAATGVGALTSTVLGWFLLLNPYIRAVRERVNVDLTSLIKPSPLRERVTVLDEFTTDFEDMIVSLVGETGRMVVFVDDLDRCPPERIVEVLDAIKLFLNVPNCLYVLGLDRGIIEEAVRVKFSDYETPRPRSQRVYGEDHSTSVRFTTTIWAADGRLSRGTRRSPSGRIGLCHSLCLRARPQSA